MEITITDAAKITGRNYQTIVRWYTTGLVFGKLPIIKRGKYIFTTLEDLHTFLSQLPAKELRRLPENYLTPLNMEPLVIPEAPPPEFGIKIREVANILCVSTERVYDLIYQDKLTIVRTEDNEPYVTHDSLESHLLKTEQWHFLRQINNARKEVYGDLISEAAKQARNQARIKAEREKRKALKRSKGRPVGSIDTRRRRRVKKFDTPPEEYPA